MDSSTYPQLVRTFLGPEFPARASLDDYEKSGVMPGMAALESAQVEITTVCNLKCQQCTRTIQNAIGAWDSRHIELEAYLSIIQTLPAAERLILQGVGEPSLHPHFRDLIVSAVETGKFQKIAFNTNGHSRNDAFWKDIASRYPLSVSLSIDSLDQRVATLCREGTNADFLFERLKLMRGIFQEFSVTIVASKLNIDDLEHTLEKIGTLGYGWVGIQDMMTSEREIALDAADRNRIDEIIAQVTTTYPELHVVRPNISAGLHKCAAPFVAPFITLEGFLSPCCAFVQPAAYEWTSVTQNPGNWEAIRTDPRVVNWMKAFIEADPPVCRACAFNPAVAEIEQIEFDRKFSTTPSGNKDA